MNIIITGHHIKITPAIENYITSKFHKIESHFSQLINVKFTLSVEKNMHVAESTLHLPQQDIHAQANDSDMYHAIEMLIKKLDIQVIKYKEKHTDHHKLESHRNQ